MDTLGRHLIGELFDCDRQRIDDIEVVAAAMRGAAERVGATVMAQAFHRYGARGVSGTLLIAESHLSVHTGPEAGYPAVDIFTCGGLDPRPGLRHIEAALGAGRCRMHEILRGLEADVARGRSLAPADVQVLARRVQ